MKTIKNKQNFEKFKKLHEEALLEYGKYVANDTKLTYQEVENLKNNIHEYKNEMDNSCPHDLVSIWRGTVTDSGYGCDRYYTKYSIVCDDCHSSLTEDYSSLDYKLKSGVPILDAIPFYEKYNHLTEKELENMGVAVKVKTVVSYERKLS